MADYKLTDLVKVGQVKKMGQLIDERLDALETIGAEANVIEGVQVNGDAITLVGKIANILIAESTVNGSLSVNGKDVPIHGLAALAYKANIGANDLASELKKQIDDATSDLTTLKGTGDGSISKQITDAINKFATDVTDDGVVNSYKELIDWVASHGGEAAEMASAIQTLEGKTVLGTHEVDGQQKEYASVKEYVEAVCSSFISLTVLSTETVGSGNAVTEIVFDPTTGKTTATKGKTFAEAKTPATAGNIAALTADGQLDDSGVGICSDTKFDAMLTEVFGSGT